LSVDDPKWRWMDKQINKQFAPFRKGITKEMLDETMKNAPKIPYGEHFVRFQILDGKVHGMAKLPLQKTVKELLERVAAVYPLPDVDIICYAADQIWQEHLLKGPVFISSLRVGGSPNVIQMPIEMSVLYEDKFVPVVQEQSENLLWENKISKIFWRGQCNDGWTRYSNPEFWTTFPRGKLCTWSREYPDLIDAAFSSFQPWQINKKTRDEFLKFFPLKRASWEEYLSHKFLIDLDGVVASIPGCYWKLLSNCTVFKHASKFSLFFYTLLKPWVHYVPLRNDLSDLFEKIDWALEHDQRAKEIAENGRQLALENFMPEHIYLYCYKVLCKYASCQRWTPSKEAL
ncbi:MAG: glycosyl transferase family 90, partial [Chlamydiales bacterium]